MDLDVIADCPVETTLEPVYGMGHPKGQDIPG